MTVTKSMIETSPSAPGFSVDDLAGCVDACNECAQVCTACADACLGEQMVEEMRHCITMDLNCADICGATARVLSRQTSYDAAMTRAALTACAEACRLCGDECEQHEAMEHCRICAAACRRCEEACRRLLDGR